MLLFGFCPRRGTPEVRNVIAAGAATSQVLLDPFSLLRVQRVVYIRDERRLRARMVGGQQQAERFSRPRQVVVLFFHGHPGPTLQDVRQVTIMAAPSGDGYFIRRASRSRADLRRLITCCRVRPSISPIAVSPTGSVSQIAARRSTGIPMEFDNSSMLAMPAETRWMRALSPSSSRRLSSSSR